MRCFNNKGASKNKRMEAQPFAFYLLPFALLVLAGCAGLFRQEEPPLKEATAEQLTQLLREREEVIQTMKGLFQAQIKGGIVGLVLDARGRPLQLPEESKMRVEQLKHWLKVLDVYPEF